MSQTDEFDWKEQERAFRIAGNTAKAMEVLKGEIAKSNSAAARVFLASMYGAKAGMNPAEIDQIIDDAERTVKDSDTDVHWELYRAYELRLGSCAAEEKPLRSFHHLLLVASHGESEMDAFAVANHYHHGSLGVDVNLLEAKKWYELARRRGHPNAVSQLKRLDRSSSPKSKKNSKGPSSN